MTEKWKLCFDIVGNFTIKSESQSIGKFIRLEEKQCQDIVDLLNEQEERIQELEKENERLKEKGEYCDNICKSFGDYYGMNIENAEWFGFNGDVE